MPAPGPELKDIELVAELVARYVVAGFGQFVGIFMVCAGLIIPKGYHKNVLTALIIVFSVLILASVGMVYYYGLFKILLIPWVVLDGITPQNINNFICCVGIFDSAILFFLVITSGGLSKSVYSPAFFAAPAAVLFFLQDPSDYAYEILTILIIVFVSIVLSYVLYVWPKLLHFSKYSKDIQVFWERNNIERHHHGVFAITFLCSLIVLPQIYIEIFLIKQ